MFKISKDNTELEFHNGFFQTSICFSPDTRKTKNGDREKDEVVSFTTVNKIHIECGCNVGRIRNGTRKPVFKKVWTRWGTREESNWKTKN